MIRGEGNINSETLDKNSRKANPFEINRQIEAQQEIRNIKNIKPEHQGASRTEKTR